MIRKNPFKKKKILNNNKQQQEIVDEKDGYNSREKKVVNRCHKL